MGQSGNYWAQEGLQRVQVDGKLGPIEKGSDQARPGKRRLAASVSVFSRMRKGGSTGLVGDAVLQGRAP